MTAAELIDGWRETAERHGYILSRKPGHLEKAAAISTNLLGGGCICKPKERPRCPCDELHDDIKEMGRCFCGIFFSPTYKRSDR